MSSSPLRGAHGADLRELCRRDYALVPGARRRRVACEATAEGEAAQGSDSPDATSLDDEVSRAERRRLRRQWAELIRRIYEADPLLCTCGAQMRVLSSSPSRPSSRRSSSTSRGLGVIRPGHRRALKLPPKLSSPEPHLAGKEPFRRRACVRSRRQNTRSGPPANLPRVRGQLDPPNNRHQCFTGLFPALTSHRTGNGRLLDWHYRKATPYPQLSVSSVRSRFSPKNRQKRHLSHAASALLSTCGDSPLHL